MPRRAAVPSLVRSLPHPLDPLAILLGWLFVSPCPLCGRSRSDPSPAGGLCPSCRGRLELPDGGLHGKAPLPWWAAGAYAGSLRRSLLDLRRRPRRAAVVALSETIRPPRPAGAGRPRLVVIPSWKRPANPLPPLLGQALAARLGWQALDLLEKRTSTTAEDTRQKVSDALREFGDTISPQE